MNGSAAAALACARPGSGVEAGSDGVRSSGAATLVARSERDGLVPPAPVRHRLRHRPAVVLLQAANERLRRAHQKQLLATLLAQEQHAAAEQALARQTGFLAMLAHELRAPLGTLNHAAILLGSERGVELLPSIRGTIQRQVAHAARLVEDLLDSTRLRTGQLHLECRPVDAATLVVDAARTCEGAITARQQTLVVELPPTPLIVAGDEPRLTQVLLNLLGNASKYTPRGGRITLALRGGADAVTLVVGDTGIGITPTALQQVFEPYVQEPHALGYDASGLGLGLALVRDLVQAHGGRVAAHSDGLGCGSRFDVTLPRAVAASARAD